MMQLDHERQDVYDLALEFLVLANGIVEGLPRGRSHNGAVRVAARPAGRGARGPGPAPQTSAYQQKRAQRLLTDRRARARARLRARASDPNSGTRPSQPYAVRARRPRALARPATQRIAKPAPMMAR